MSNPPPPAVPSLPPTGPRGRCPGCGGRRTRTLRDRELADFYRPHGGPPAAALARPRECRACGRRWVPVPPPAVQALATAVLGVWLAAGLLFAAGAAARAALALFDPARPVAGRLAGVAGWALAGGFGAALAWGCRRGLRAVRGRRTGDTAPAADPVS